MFYLRCTTPSFTLHYRLC